MNGRVEEILKPIESGNPEALAEGVEALRRLGREARPALVEALQSENPLVRWAAAAALGDIGDEAAAADLKRGLEDDSTSVRVRSAYSLAQLGDRSGVPVLLDALASDEVMVGHPPELVADFADQALRSISGKFAPGEETKGDRAERWRAWWSSQPTQAG